MTTQRCLDRHVIDDDAKIDLHILAATFRGMPIKRPLPPTAKRLRQAMGIAKLSAKSLGKKTGLSRNAIQSYADGTRTGLTHIKAMAAALGVSEDWLLTGNTPPPWAVNGATERVEQVFSHIPESVPLEDSIASGTTLAKDMYVKSGLFPRYSVEMDFFEICQLRVLLNAIGKINPDGLEGLFEKEVLARLNKKLETMMWGVTGGENHLKQMTDAIAGMKIAGKYMDMANELFARLRTNEANKTPDIDYDRIFNDTVAKYGFEIGMSMLPAIIEKAHSESLSKGPSAPSGPFPL